MEAWRRLQWRRRVRKERSGTSFTTVRPAALTRSIPWPGGGKKMLHLMTLDPASAEIVRLPCSSSEAANCVSNLFTKLQVAERDA